MPGRFIPATEKYWLEETTNWSLSGGGREDQGRCGTSHVKVRMRDGDTHVNTGSTAVKLQGCAQYVDKHMAESPQGTRTKVPGRRWGGPV